MSNVKVVNVKSIRHNHLHQDGLHLNKLGKTFLANEIAHELRITYGVESVVSDSNVTSIKYTYEYTNSEVKTPNDANKIFGGSKRTNSNSSKLESKGGAKQWGNHMTKFNTGYKYKHEKSHGRKNMKHTNFPRIHEQYEHPSIVTPVSNNKIFSNRRFRQNNNYHSNSNPHFYNKKDTYGYNHYNQCICSMRYTAHPTYSQLNDNFPPLRRFNMTNTIPCKTKMYRNQNRTPYRDMTSYRPF